MTRVERRGASGSVAGVIAAGLMAAPAPALADENGAGFWSESGFSWSNAGEIGWRPLPASGMAGRLSSWLGEPLTSGVTFVPIVLLGTDRDWEHGFTIEFPVAGWELDLESYFGAHVQSAMACSHSRLCDDRIFYTGLRVHVLENGYLAWQHQQASSFDPATHWLMVGVRW